MFTRIAVLMGILLAGTLAGGEGMTTTPASTEHVASQAELDGCLQHCREAFSQIEETLRIMEAARDRDDPEELQRAMAAARSKLIAARLAADVLGVPTVFIGRTDSLGASLIRGDIDKVDQEFLTGERTADGFFIVKGSMEYAVARACAYAPYVDVVWC
ncbi:MAG TPA: hypothetical protein PLS23_08080, partial [Phycisphaerae bacterium]|nr:hypothetical protein [Phycisphaerae bacterium]